MANGNKNILKVGWKLVETGQKDLTDLQRAITILERIWSWPQYNTINWWSQYPETDENRLEKGLQQQDLAKFTDKGPNSD